MVVFLACWYLKKHWRLLGRRGGDRGVAVDPFLTITVAYIASCSLLSTTQHCLIASPLPYDIIPRDPRLRISYPHLYTQSVEICVTKQHFLQTPAKRLTWQERPEDGIGARKREWGEVTAGPAPIESVYSCPVTPSTAGWGKQNHGGRPPTRSSTPRERKTPSWVCSSESGGGGGDGDSRSASAGWRRASSDLGHTAMAAAAAATGSESGEDSLGYPLMPCDGRECKIRIVERLGEIKGSRASSTSAGSEAPGDSSSGSGGSGGAGNCTNAGPNSKPQLKSALVGRAASATPASGGLVLGVGAGGGEIDDTELNELGDNELEGLLEQMWMQVIGQVRYIERADDREKSYSADLGAPYPSSVQETTRILFPFLLAAVLLHALGRDLLVNPPLPYTRSVRPFFLSAHQSGIRTQRPGHARLQRIALHLPAQSGLPCSGAD